MNNSRAIIMLIFAVLAGLVAVVMASQWISKQGSMNTNKIAVAGLDIELGGRINPEMLKMVDWPAGSIPEGAFTEIKNLDTRVAKTTITRGEPVIEAKLAPLGTKGGLSAVVAEGKRAMTVRVNDVVGVAGFALPGNYVDILVNTQEEGSKSGSRETAISKIVLEKILVLAVAQEAGRDDTKPKVVNAVTLELTPEQAELLDLARSVGTLSLVLRNQVDPKFAGTEGATKLSMLNALEKKTAPVAAEPAKSAPTKTVVKRVVQFREVAVAPPAPPAPVCAEVLTGSGRVRECY
jgi:pilus assembly protein CpaB